MGPKIKKLSDNIAWTSVKNAIRNALVLGFDLGVDNDPVCCFAAAPDERGIWRCNAYEAVTAGKPVLTLTTKHHIHKINKGVNSVMDHVATPGARAYFWMKEKHSIITASPNCLSGPNLGRVDFVHIHHAIEYAINQGFYSAMHCFQIHDTVCYFYGCGDESGNCGPVSFIVNEDGVDR